MTEPDQSAESGDAAKLPQDFRPRPSRNQKLRSKLRQAPDEPAGAESAAEAETAPAEPAPPPPAQNTPAAPALPLKARRLKRSGHMHDSVTGPLPEEEPPDPDRPEY
ncbi:MAG TPA: hypothetical protein VG095_04745 [Chthoniobacterales bacterium]|nr:hypothetical protein [Chthoniobacterales bacterium]